MENLDFGIEAGVRGANQYIRDVDRMDKATRKSMKGVSESTDGARSSFDELADVIPGVGKAAELVKNPLVILTTVITGLILAFTTVIGSAEEFNHEFLSLQNLNIDKTSEQIDGLRDSVLSAAFETGKSAKAMSQAFFDIQSGTGLFGDEVEAIAKKVANFSTATKVDFNTAIGASIKAIRAFKLGVEDLDGFLASSFATVQLGIVTFDQLSKVQTDFAGAAAGAGQNVDTANKIFAGFTATAKSAEEAATLTKTAFQDLGKKPTIDGLKAIGVSMYDANGAIRDTTDVITDLVPKFKAMSQQRFDEVLASIGGSEGLRGLLLQVRNEGEGLLVVFSNFDKAKGNFDFEALLENAKGDFTTLKDIVGNQLNTVFTQIGVKILPMLARALNEVMEIMPVIIGFVKDNATAFKALGIAAGIVAGGILLAKTAIGAYNVITMLSTAITVAYEAVIVTLQASYIALTGSTTIAAGAMKAFQILMASNPYTLAIAAVATLAAGLYLLMSRTKELTDVQKLNIELGKRVGEEYGKQTASVDILFGRLKTLDTQSVAYKETIKLINEQYGEYLPNLLTNKTSLEDIEVAQKAVNAALMEKIRLQIKEQKLTEISSEFFGKAINVQAELSKSTGLTAEQLDKAAREIGQSTKNLSVDAVNSSLNRQARQTGFAALLEDVIKFGDVSDETRATLQKITGAGNDAAFWFQDLALGTGNFLKQIDDVNNFFTQNDPIGGASDDLANGKKNADGFADGIGKVTDKAKELNDGMMPSVGSIAMYELELSKLEAKFKAAGDAMERVRLAERITEIKATIEALRSTPQGTDPLDELAGMGATNVSDTFSMPAADNMSAMSYAINGAMQQADELNQKFKDLAGTVKSDLTSAFGESIFMFGKMVAEGESAGEAAKAALLGLADVVLVQVPKYIGLFLLQTAVGLGFPAGVPFALGGIGLLAFSGIASGLLGKLGGGASAAQQAATTATSSVPSASSSLATPSGVGLSSFNAGEYDQNRQVVQVYIGNKEVTNLLRADILRELDLQGG